MTSTDTMSADDKDFLAKCEEELKHRYTEQDEEFMKVFNAEASIPPIIKSWWDPQNSRRRNDRRNNRHNPYGNRDHDRRRYNDYNRDHDRRGYNDYSSRGQGYHNQRHPYY